MVDTSDHSASSASLSGASSWDQQLHTSRSSSIASSSSRMNRGDEGLYSRFNTSPAGTPLPTPLDTGEKNDPLATSPNSKSTHCILENTASPTPRYEKPNPFESAHRTKITKQGSMALSGDRDTTPTSWVEVRQSLSLSSVVGQPNSREMELAKHCFFQIMKAVETTPMSGQSQRKESGASSPAE
ncbi:uncharacterized protein L199_000478 [Kwoniella botswanensis]|uniref:uncharacterized protein n=1 Tax=Kwoniella botswanensis TaxID=1268659 RepID=UPI00315CBD42